MCQKPTKEYSSLSVNFHSIVQKIRRRKGIKEVDAYCLLDEDGSLVKLHVCNPGNVPEQTGHYEGNSLQSLFPSHLSPDVLFHIRMASQKDKLVSTIYEYEGESGVIFHVVVTFFRTPFLLDEKHVLAGFFSTFSMETPSPSKKDFPVLPFMPQEKRFYLCRAQLAREILTGSHPLSSNARETLRSFGVTERTSLLVCFISEPLHEDSRMWNGGLSEEAFLSLYSWQNRAVEYLNREMRIISWCYFEGVAFFVPLVEENVAYPDLKDEKFELGECVLKALRYIFPKKDLVLGVGENSCSISGIRSSLRQARKAVYGSLFGLHGRVFHYRDLGYGTLFNNEHQEDALFKDILQPLFSRECEKMELLLTLEALLEKNSLAEAAQEMHVHINTMIYRKKQIEELLGMDLSDKYVKINLFFSVKSWKISHVQDICKKTLKYCKSLGGDVFGGDFFDV